MPKGKTSLIRLSWFDWHSWIGATLGLMLFSICWSGAFAVLSSEIDWVLNPAMRVQSHSGEINIPAAFSVVTRAYPNARIELFEEPPYDYFAARFSIITDIGARRYVYVDPQSLQITGEQSIFTVQRFFREFHEALFGLYGIGKFVIGIFAIPLLFSLVSALVFYRRWWQRFLDFRAAKTAVSFWSSVHKLAGLWSIWFVLLIAITGSWYLYEEARYKLGDHKFALVDSFPLAVNILPKLEISDDNKKEISHLIDVARTVRPDMHITKIYPNRAGYFYVIGQSDDWLVRDRANKLFINPKTGQVVFNQYADQLDTYWRWSEMADPLHFGSFGGFVTKIIWGLFGLVLAGLSLSGGWLYIQKQIKKRSKRLKWRGTLLAAVIVSLLPLAITPIIWIFLHRIGGKINGEYVMADVSVNVTVFLATWVFVTAAIHVAWIAKCYRLLRRGVPG